MSQEDVEVVREIFEAFNSEDIDLILSFTHSDFDVEVPPDLSAEPDTYRGQDGMRRFAIGGPSGLGTDGVGVSG